MEYLPSEIHCKIAENLIFLEDLFSLSVSCTLLRQSFKIYGSSSFKVNIYHSVIISFLLQDEEREKMLGGAMGGGRITVLLQYALSKYRRNKNIIILYKGCSLLSYQRLGDIEKEIPIYFNRGNTCSFNPGITECNIDENVDKASLIITDGEAMMNTDHMKEYLYAMNWNEPPHRLIYKLHKRPCYKHTVFHCEDNPCYPYIQSCIKYGKTLGYYGEWIQGNTKEKITIESASKECELLGVKLYRSHKLDELRKFIELPNDERSLLLIFSLDEYETYGLSEVVCCIVSYYKHNLKKDENIRYPVPNISPLHLVHIKN